MKQRILWSLTLSIALIVNSAYAEEASTRSVKITTTTSSMKSVEYIEHALGRILDPARTTVSAEIPARVDSVLVDVGQRIEKGDTLATLDDKDMTLALKSAQANLARSKAQEKAQTSLVQRYRKLVKEKFISTTMLEQAEAQAIGFKEAVRTAKAQVKQSRLNLQRTHISAPVSGIVEQRFVASGDYIGRGKPIFTLISDEQLVIAIAIPETKAHDIRVGLPVRLHLPNSHHTITAPISDLNPAIGTRSNALEARIHLDNPNHWRPGGSVIADIILTTHHDAVVVSESSVVLRPDGDVVYTIQNNRAHAIPVTTGVRNGGDIEILQGLKSNVLLAEVGASFLSEGATVEVTAP